MKSKNCKHCGHVNFIKDFCEKCGQFIYDPHDRDWDENEISDWWKRGEDRPKIRGD